MSLINDDISDAKPRFVLTSVAMETTFALAELDQVSLCLSVDHHVDEVRVAQEITLEKSPRIYDISRN